MKKRMKTGAVAAFLVGIMALSAGDLFARGWGRGDGPRNGYGRHHRGPGGPGHHFRGLDFLKVELGLSDKQVLQIFDLHQKYDRQFFLNRNNVQKMLELRAEKHKEIKKVLTPNQAKKFDAMFLRCGPRGRWGHNGFRRGYGR